MSQHIFPESQKLQLNLARLTTHGETFEINVDPDLAVKFKHGEDVSIKDVLKAEKIFNDCKKGLLASEIKLKEIFATQDPLEIAKKILTDGEIQLTAEHRKRISDAKYKRIISFIHRNAIDPKSGLPHPQTRIENAIAEAKAKVDLNKRDEEVIQNIIKQIQPIIPIKFDKKQLEINVGSQYASKCIGVLNQFGSFKQNWGSDGSLNVQIEIPAGLFTELIDKLNSATHGDVQVKEMKNNE